MQLAEFVQSLVEFDHMGELDEINPDCQLTFVSGHRSVRVSWNAIYHGKKVRQYQELKLGSMCLGDFGDDRES